MEAQLKRHKPLFLKHRPQALDELVGQESVRQTLSNAINFNRLSNAYLFTGPRGTGKTSSARILAKSLNCQAGEKPTMNPCQKCSSCLDITSSSSTAVFEIDAASNNSVDDARVLIERATLVAAGGRYKIYIIDECHMLSSAAFNALLKTIEEPPANVIFMLATTEENKVLPTIVSRCQRLMFRLVQHEDLVAHLRGIADKENIEITEQAIEFIARRSGGGLRDALGLLDQASLLSSPGNPADIGNLLALLGALQEDVLLEMSDCVLQRKGQELLTAANKVLYEGREPAVVVQELARHFLNLSKASYLQDCPDRVEVASKLIVGSPDYLNALHEQAPKFERSELSQLVEVLGRLEQTCRRTTQPGMHMEVGLLSLCHRNDMLLIRELAARVTQLEKALAGGAIIQAQSGSHRPSPGPGSTPHTSPQPSVAASNSREAQAPIYTQPADPERAPASTPSRAMTNSNGQPTPPPSAGSPQPQATAPAQRSATKSNQMLSDAEEDSGDSMPSHEVDRIWFELLSEIQRTHIPTHGMIMSANAFPLRISETELSIGVTSELFQKNLEGRLDRIKVATASVIGKPLHIKVRVVTREMPATQRAAAAPRERSMSPAPAASGGAPGPDSDDDYEPAKPIHRPSLSAPPIHGTDLPPDAPAFPPRDAMPADSYSGESTRPGNTASLMSKGPQTGSSPASNSAATVIAPSGIPGTGINAEELAAQSTNANTGAIIKEAYKLFEGPGSRLLGGGK